MSKSFSAQTPSLAALTAPAPRWAVVAAHVAALTPVPSSIWRILLVFGIPGGYTQAGLEELDPTGLGAAWLILLSVLTEGAALLTLGLVRQWGVVAPQWLPVIGGQSIPPWAAAGPAVVGTLILAGLWTPFLFWWTIPHPDMTASGSFILGFLYLPLVLWAPLLGAVTWNYLHRRRDITTRT